MSVPPDDHAPKRFNRPIDRQDVIAAYHLILGREPESEEGIRNNLLTGDLVSLRNTFLSSHEFRRWRMGLPITAAPLQIEIEASPPTLAEMVTKIAQYWESIGRKAPHWSVLTAREFLPENIQSREQAFFGSSRVDQGIILSGLARIGMKPADFQSCAEFGCGVGRLTLRLASMFPQVIGVDISIPHLDLAQAYCGRLGLMNVSFLQSSALELMPAKGFDFWFSRIVLQHNPPPVTMEILRQAFLRLPKGGVAMFQVPVHHIGYQFSTERYLASDLGRNMEMHCVPQRAIFEMAHSVGMQLLDLREDTWVVSGEPDWLSNNFIFQKKD
jgi:SAM-dependent methyltransferase